MFVSTFIRIKKVTWLILWILVAFWSAPEVEAQRLALKTNALEYAALSPNLTFEARISRKLSLQLGVAANPFSFAVANTRLTNFRVEPELRYWFNRPMARHFIALSATAGTYNMRFGDKILIGDALLAGLSYGYAVVLSDHWNMEAEIGVGVGSFKAYKYSRPEAKPAEPNFSRMLPVPVRFGLSFAYIFK